MLGPNGIGVLDEPADYSTDPHWELMFTDTAGTGSAFDWNGSVGTIVNGSNTDVLTLDQLNSTSLYLHFRTFRAFFVLM